MLMSLDDELRIFSEWVENNFIYIRQQENIIYPAYQWCADYWTVEMCRCLILGEEKYKQSPKKYLVHEELQCFVPRIITEVSYKRKMMQTLDSIKDFSSNIMFCEIGRGIDVVLANHIKPWGKLMGYDVNLPTLNKTSEYFPYLKLIQKHTSEVDFAGINEDTILIAHVTRIGNSELSKISSNKHLKLIKEGELINERS